MDHPGAAQHSIPPGPKSHALARGLALAAATATAVAALVIADQGGVEAWRPAAAVGVMAFAICVAALGSVRSRRRGACGRDDDAAVTFFVP